jgi:hypothetical protein
VRLAVCLSAGLTLLALGPSARAQMTAPADQGPAGQPMAASQIVHQLHAVARSRLELADLLLVSQRAEVRALYDQILRRFMPLLGQLRHQGARLGMDQADVEQLGASEAGTLSEPNAELERLRALHGPAREAAVLAQLAAPLDAATTERLDFIAANAPTPELRAVATSLHAALAELGGAAQLLGVP